MQQQELSARHFTDSAQRVVRHVAERALDRGMLSGELTEATAGMLALLSILRWERKVALAALERLGADLDRLAREVDAAIGTEGQESRRAGGPRFEVLPSGQRALVVDTDTPMGPLLERAEHQALGLGHTWVGTEHLLLAAVQFACPRFREVLDQHTVSYERVRQAVLDVLRPDPPETGSPA
jgi:ATP-dependent Clp protease ATP-binding subunit ClpA